MKKLLLIVLASILTVSMLGSGNEASCKHSEASRGIAEYR